MSQTATAVQVVLINPGFVNTPMVDKVAADAKRERMLQPDDIAEVCHSCSPLQTTGPAVSCITQPGCCYSGRALHSPGL